MQVHLHGTAASRASVNIVNRAGDILATTATDPSGKWGTNVELSVGDEVRAEVSVNGGRDVQSEWITISAEVEPLDANAQVEADESRQRLETVYVDIARALADGYEVDAEQTSEVLALLDLTLDDVERDARRLQVAAYGPAVPAIN